MRSKQWKPEYTFEMYELARRGATNLEIAQRMNISTTQFNAWLQQHKLLRLGIKHARKLKKPIRTNNKQTPKNEFYDYCTSRLSQEHRDVWQQVNLFNSKNNAYERLEVLFALKGEQMRKHLFIYALCKAGFNLIQACRKLGITFGLLKHWIATDPLFSKSIDVIHEYKNEYLESALMKKIAEGDTKAIIFANETQNKKPSLLHTGYGKEIDVTVNGQITHTHEHKFDLAQLELPLETKRVILEAVRAKKLDEQIVAPPQLQQLIEADA